MKQKTHDVGEGANSGPDTSGDGVLKDLAAKAKALAPDLDASATGDPRRRGEITIKKLNDARYYLGIDGDIWGEVDWNSSQNAWCIQDACGYCLSFKEHVQAHIPNDGVDKPTQSHHLNPTTALEKTKQMIRDGTMPSPEDARATFLKDHGHAYKQATRMPD